MPILESYHQFDGLHWVTGYLRNVLDFQGARAPHTGRPYSEAMLMGIAGGLSAGYFAFEYEGREPHLHFLTRYPFNDEMPPVIYDRLAIARNLRHTSDPEKGAANVIGALAQGHPAVVWADITTLYHDDLIPQWMVTPVIVYGYDIPSDTVTIADRAQAPIVVTTRTLAAARARIDKTKHRMMTVGEPDPDKLSAAIKDGIQACIEVFTGNPPVGGEAAKGNFGFSAYLKWADLLMNNRNKKSWSKQFAPGPRMYAGLTSAFRYIEVFFTGGCGARDLYADFLDEAAAVLDNPGLRDVAGIFRTAAQHWHALTQALLPDNIAPFRESRELMVRSYQLFRAQGQAALADRRAINERLKIIKAEVAEHFPLTDSEAAIMRAGLRDHVMAIHDIEVEAIAALRGVTGLDSGPRDD